MAASSAGDEHELALGDDVEEVLRLIAKQARSGADAGLGDGFRLVSGGGAVAADDPRQKGLAELDVADFDAVEYLNRHFPDEASLSGGRLEQQLRQWDYDISKLDDEVLVAVREQAVAGMHAAQDVEHAKASIMDLFDKTRDIKARADDAERMAEEICKDIRELDTAKTHLATTLGAVKNLQLLCTSMAQLQRAVAEREYTGTGQLLGVVRQLLGSAFEAYSSAPVIAALMEAENAVRGRLRELMAEDFEVLTETGSGAALFSPAGGGGGGGGGDDGALPGLASIEDADAGADEAAAAMKKLEAACEVVDALGGQCLADRIGAFLRKQMRPYEAAFGGENAEGDGAGALVNAERRFQWFRRTLREVDRRYGPLLPERWTVQHRLCVAFCEQTRADFESQLASYDPPDSVPPEALLRALQRSLEFEQQMVKRFEKPKTAGAEAGSAPQSGAGAGAGSGLASAVQEALGGGGAGGDAGGGGIDADEVLDESAPLVNEAGEVVDPTSAEGVKLKYKRRKEWAAAAEERRKRRAAKAAQAAFLRGVGGDGVGSDAASAAAAAAATGWGEGAVFTGAGSIEELPVLPPLKRIIASAFDPNMGSYVKLELSKLDDIVSGAAADPAGDSMAAMGAEEMGDDDESGTAAGLSLFDSSTRLLVQLRGAVERCCKLSTGQTLYSLFRESRAMLVHYAEVMERRLPKPVKAGPLGPLPQRDEQEAAKALTFTTPPEADALAMETIDRMCLVVNTAEFCGESAPQLAELVAMRADAEFAEHVNADEAEDRFFEVAARGTRVLAAWCWSLLDRDLVSLIRTDWARITDIGDQSPFVGSMARKLHTVFPRIRHLLGQGYFRQFCEHFVRGFIHRYMSCIYKPRSGIGEMGAQQLLLDTQTLRDVLVKAPTVLTEEESDAEVALPAPPATYTKFIRTELPRAELLLKLVGTPVETFAANVTAMWGEASRSDLERVLALKGLRRADMMPILAQLGKTGPDSPAPHTLGRAAPGASGGRKQGTPVAGAAGAAGAASGGMGAALSAVGKGITGAVGGLAKLGRGGAAGQS